MMNYTGGKFLGNVNNYQLMYEKIISYALHIFHTVSTATVFLFFLLLFRTLAPKNCISWRQIYVIRQHVIAAASTLSRLHTFSSEANIYYFSSYLEVLSFCFFKSLLLPQILFPTITGSSYSCALFSYFAENISWSKRCCYQTIYDTAGVSTITQLLLPSTELFEKLICINGLNLVLCLYSLQYSFRSNLICYNFLTVELAICSGKKISQVSSLIQQNWRSSLIAKSKMDVK
jgi:hypothetical protein